MYITIFCYTSFTVIKKNANFKSLTIINENRNINKHKHSVIQNIVSSKSWGAKGMGGKRHGGQKTGGQKAWGAKGRGAKGRGAKDRGAKDRGVKDRGAKVLSPVHGYRPGFILGIECMLQEPCQNHFRPRPGPFPRPTTY